MTTTIDDRRQEILALEPRLLESAQALTGDAQRAKTLVAQTLKIAQAQDYGAAESSGAQVWVFRLLRQRLHSVERDRDVRRHRSAAVTELGHIQKRGELAQAAEPQAPSDTL